MRLVVRDLPVFGVDLAAAAGFCAWWTRWNREGGANSCGKGEERFQVSNFRFQRFKVSGFASFKLQALGNVFSSADLGTLKPET
jgi:hypothetical protein